MWAKVYAVALYRNSVFGAVGAVFRLESFGVIILIGSVYTCVVEEIRYTVSVL